MPTRRHRKAVNQPGHAHELTFSCYRGFDLLSRDRSCEWMAEAVREARLTLRFELWAYVFMPNHAHLILRPADDRHDVAAILQRIKQPVSRRAMAWLAGNAPEWLDRLTVARGKRTERRFWQRGGGYDRNITEPATLAAMIEYVHLNPVRKGLVDRAADWKWSSAGWFEGQAPNGLSPDAIPHEWAT